MPDGPVNPFAPPGAQAKEPTIRDARARRSAGRTLAAMVLGIAASTGSYSAMALAANHVLASRTVSRGSIGILECAVMVALVSASTSIGALIGVTVQPRPWWGAPTGVGACAAASLAVIYIGRGSVVPIVGILVPVALLVPVLVGRAFARRSGRPRNADSA